MTNINSLILMLTLFLTISLAVTPLQADKSTQAVDSDADGLSDIDEARIHKTDSRLPDTDTDGLTDGSEIEVYLTNPLIADSDGDGFIDGIEAKHGSDPLDPESKPRDDLLDLDGDGLSNKEEKLQYHTDFQRSDSDFDGLSDFKEVQRYFSDPLTVDSDGDSFWDGEEVIAGTDPTDADDFPK